MSWLPVSRRRHFAEVADARAEANRQRERAEAAVKDKGTAEFNRDQVLAQNADLHAANTRLTSRNKALGQRLAEAQVANGFNPVAARRTAERIATLQKAAAVGRDEAAKARAEAKRDRQRADQLQRRLDDAVGLPPGGPLSSAVWQPGYQAPTPDGQASTS